MQCNKQKPNVKASISLCHHLKDFSHQTATRHNASRPNNSSGQQLTLSSPPSSLLCELWVSEFNIFSENRGTVSGKEVTR